MRRIFATLLALVLCISAIGVTAFAAETGAISVPNAEGTRGQNVTLTVQLTSNPGVASMKYDVSYDETRLEKVSYAQATDMGGVWTIIDYLVWDAGADSTYTGPVLNLTFKVKENAPAGDATVTVSYLEGFSWTTEEAVAISGDSGVITIPELPHTECTDFENVDEVPATCTANGTKAHQKCTECGKLYIDGVEVSAEDVVIKALGHTYEGYVADADGHYQVCTRCGEATEKVAHEFKNYATTTPSTCVVKGTETGTCVCGYTHTRELALAKHTPKLADYKAATKTEEGYKKWVCAVCGCDLGTDIIPKLPEGGNKVPSTGDITPVLYAGGFSVFAMLAAVAYVLKRKFAR